MVRWGRQDSTRGEDVVDSAALEGVESASRHSATAPGGVVRLDRGDIAPEPLERPPDVAHDRGRHACDLDLREGLAGIDRVELIGIRRNWRASYSCGACGTTTSICMFLIHNRPLLLMTDFAAGPISNAMVERW